MTPTKYLEIHDLVLRLKAGEDAAYSDLCDRYTDLLLGIIFKIVRDESMAENVLQDCFVKVWKYVQNYDSSKGSFATWLINIARNAAIDFTRSKYYSQKFKNQSIDQFVSSSRDISDFSDASDTIGLSQIVQMLAPQYQEIIDCLYFKGYTQQEIADEFAIPLGTVKTRTRSALSELRKYYGLVS